MSSSPVPGPSSAPDPCDVFDGPDPVICKDLQDFLAHDDDDDDDLDLDGSFDTASLASSASSVSLGTHQEVMASIRLEQERHKDRIKILDELEEKNHIRELDDATETKEDDTDYMPAPPERPNRVREKAPGLNIFMKERFRVAFKHDTLSLEEEFGYKGRARLLRPQLGFTSEFVDSVLTDPELFIAYLAPTACSALIADETEFRVVCDYLFFYAASCTDDLRREMFGKALFDLLTNYSWQWRLTCSHIWTALFNLGMRPRCLETEEHLSFIMESRIKAIKRKKKEFVYARPHFHHIMLSKKETPAEAADGPDDGEAYDLISWFIGFVSDLLCTHFGSTEFFRRGSKAPSNWLPHLHLAYLCGLLATDVHLLHDAIVWERISLIYHSLFNCFSKDDWSGMRGHECAENNFIEVISRVFSADGNKAVKTWENDWMPADPILKHFHGPLTDHHHNMVRRLDSLPLTYRGSRVRKGVAFQHLQQIINPPQFNGLHLSRSAELADKLFEENDKIFRRLFIDRYTMLNVIRLLDNVVGGETADHGPKNDPFIANFRKYLDQFRQCPAMKRGTSSATDEFKEVLAVNEVITQTTSKWETLRQRHRKITGEDEVDTEDE